MYNISWFPVARLAHAAIYGLAVINISSPALFPLLAAIKSLRKFSCHLFLFSFRDTLRFGVSLGNVVICSCEYSQLERQVPSLGNTCTLPPLCIFAYAFHIRSMITRKDIRVCCRSTSGVFCDSFTRTILSYSAG